MKILVILGVVFVVAISGYFVVLPAVLEHFAFKRLSPEQVAYYNSWKNKKLTIPAGALRVAPFAPATESAAVAMRKAWGKDNTRAQKVAGNHFRRDGESSSRLPLNLDFAAINRDLAELAPLIKAFETLVAQPDYEMSAQTAGLLWGDGNPESSGVSIPDFMAEQVCAKLLCMKARAQANSGQSAQALDTAAAIVRAGRGSAYDMLISQLVGIAVCSIGTHAWEDVVASCKDSQLLRETLAKQNKLIKEQVYMAANLPITVPDRLGIVRYINRRGMNVTMQGLTERQMSGVISAAEAEYYEKIVLPKFRGDPAQAAKVKLSIKSAQIQSGFYGHRPHSAYALMAWVTQAGLGPLFFAMAIPNFLEAATRAEVARAQFDLLRLNTAQRIWTLEHGAPPAHMTDLVPSLLTSLPVDRFAKDKTPYGEGAIWHSIGPDGVDQKGETVYDPTNGTKSVGDIVLAR